MFRSSYALFKIYWRTYSGINRLQSITPMDLRPGTNSHKMYVRALKEDQRAEIRIHYVDKNLGVDRWFNFNRSQEDSVQQIKERITANIDKECQKRKKKMESKNKKKENNPDLVEYKLVIDLKQNNQTIDSNVLFKNLLQMNDISLSINDTIYHLDVNPPLVISLKLPNSVMAGFNIYPVKLEIENCDVSQCEFMWFKSPPFLSSAPNADSDSWIVAGLGMIYSVTNLDIGRWLKIRCIPKVGEKEGLPEVAFTSQVIEAGPGPCPFETRHKFTQERMNESGFRVVTYNILADLYADSDFTRTTLHPYCPPYALTIDYRKQLILKELIGYNADIICLQEVDNKVFDGDLAPILLLLNYKGVFSKKGGQVSEGLACFFNTSKFRLVYSETFILSSVLPENPLLADVYAAVIRNEKLMTRIMERTTALQLIVLESIQSAKRIVVANTHLYYHPDADHIRLLQANVGLRLAQDLQRKEMEQNKDVSLVFCGDFNSCPGYGVFEMMTLQNIDENYAAWSSNPEEAVTNFSIHNPVAMESACGTPLFTNYTSGFNGCLDYIFIEKSKLSVQQVVPLSTLEEVKQHVALPSIVFPSDHVALVADLKWI